MSNMSSAEAIAKYLQVGDWHEAYTWIKGWVGSGGGQHLPEAWLAYAATAVLQKQPKNAVHSLDIGLKHWVQDPIDREILLHARDSIVASAGKKLSNTASAPEYIGTTAEVSNAATDSSAEQIASVGLIAYEIINDAEYYS